LAYLLLRGTGLREGKRRVFKSRRLEGDRRHSPTTLIILRDIKVARRKLCNEERVEKPKDEA